MGGGGNTGTSPPNPPPGFSSQPKVSRDGWSLYLATSMRPAQFPAAVFSGTPAALCHPVSPCVTPPIAAASKMLLGDMKLVGRALCLPQPLCLPPPLPRSSSPGGHQPRGHPGATKRMPALFPGAEDDIARGGGIFGQQSPSPPQRAGFRIEPSCAAAAPQLSQPQAWVTSASGGGGGGEAGGN